MKNHPSPFASVSFRKDRIAWGIFLGIVIAITGWSSWSNQGIVLESPPAISSDPRIAVIAYSRVFRDEEEGLLSSARFQAHLTALLQHGFTPITLAALHDFYDHGKPLPAKPLLLTFDNGELDTYISVDPILRQLKWPAVMFIKSARQERRESHFLNWKQLKKMLESHLWEIGSNGHNGDDLIFVDYEGTTEPYLIGIKWLENEGRTETLSEFQKRVWADYRDSKAALTSHLKETSGLAFALTFPDPLRITGSRKIARIHQETLRTFYTLGFVDDRFGVNDRLTNRYRLKRLRVDPSWSPEDLVHLLSSAVALPAKINKAEPDRITSHQWFAEDGYVALEEDVLDMRGTPRAAVWLPGSQWADTWMLETDLWLEGGTFWVTQEHASVESELWRFGGDQKALLLQHRPWEEPIETVARVTGADMAYGKWHHLKMIRRGRGLWVEWNGHPLSDHPFYLAGPRRGDIGLIAWQDDAPVHLRLAHLVFKRYHYNLRRVEHNPSVQTVHGLAEAASEIAAIAPPWLEIEGEHLTEQFIERNIVSLLAHRYGLDVLPVVRMVGAPETALSHTPLWAELIHQIEQAEWDGVTLDLTALTPEIQKAWVSTFDLWDPMVIQQGYQLLRMGNTMVLSRWRHA